VDHLFHAHLKGALRDTETTFPDDFDWQAAGVVWAPWVQPGGEEGPSQQPSPAPDGPGPGGAVRAPQSAPTDPNAT
jgi:hypothetical protein